MCVFLFDVFNGCSVVKKQIKVKECQTFAIEKSGVLKTCQKGKFIGKKIWRNELPLKSKKVQGIFRETFI